MKGGRGLSAPIGLDFTSRIAIKQPRPRFRNHVRMIQPNRIPLFRQGDQPPSHRVQVDVTPHVIELARRAYQSLVIPILPFAVGLLKAPRSFGSHETHHCVHESRQRPVFHNAEQCVPVIGHDYKSCEGDALLFDGEMQCGADEFALFCMEHGFSAAVTLDVFCDKKCAGRIAAPVKAQIF